MVETDTMCSEDVIAGVEERALLRLRRFREERQMSQLELSLASGVSQNMITYIETGKRVPSLRTVIKLCAALGVSPASLFELEEEERAEAKRMVLEAVQKYM